MEKQQAYIQIRPKPIEKWDIAGETKIYNFFRWWVSVWEGGNVGERNKEDKIKQFCM